MFVPVPVPDFVVVLEVEVVLLPMSAPFVTFALLPLLFDLELDAETPDISLLPPPLLTFVSVERL